MANCPNCNGVGEIEGPPGSMRISLQIKSCPTCDGYGSVSTEIARWWYICPSCHGWGEIGMLIAPDTCPSCRGVGMVSRGRGRVI